MNETRFTAFYSYKGGVGRSLTLANLAYILAFEGRKVLIVDMDLEAPGQHATDLFKDVYNTGGLQPKGIMDLLYHYKEYRENLPVSNESGRDLPSPFEWHLNNYLLRSNVFDKRIIQQSEKNPDANGISDNNESKCGSLWLLPATGKLGDNFQEYLNQLGHWDWDNFYAEEAGSAFFDALKNQIKSENFDEVIIDSRTGFSDVFYTTTLLLADTVVCVSGLNRQNIEGTRQAINALIKPQNTKVYGDKRIILVGSPVPTGSMKESDIQKREREIVQEWRKFPGWGVSVPYHPVLALREELLTMDSDNPFKDRTQYVEAMIQLYHLMEEKETRPNLERFYEKERINPFPSIRVDYWNESEVVNHFVDPGNNIRYALEQFMPTIVFGSRGTGKTMLARWFDYETIAFRLEQNGQQPEPETVKQIGLWFRLDIDLLNAFNCDTTGPRENFNLLFGQFFDLLVLRKALMALERFGGLDAWLSSVSLYKILSREMGCDNLAKNYEDVSEQIDHRLWEIRAYINNPDTRNMPFVVQSNVLMKVLVEHLHQQTIFHKRGHYFAVFIDEYENFHVYQQRIVNTRLKQSKESDRVTYKLLARNDGIHTYDTLAKGQLLEDTHDLRIYNLDEGISYKDFFPHVKKVVQKHLEASPYFSDYNDPEKLFVALSLSEEIIELSGKRGAEPLHGWIKKNHSAETYSLFLDWFESEPSLLRKAVAVVVVNQGKSVESVIKAFKLDTNKAQDWYHNYHVGALYWLYSLYHKKKCYTGFRHITGIAGNNTRVALDLCYIIIEQWLASEKKHSLPIPANIQNNAIHMQSETYFRRLVEKGQDVGQIHRFVQRLGRLFEIIHKGPRQSEPEINHFKIEGELLPKVESILRRCRTDAVLRWLPGNKQKSLADERRDAWQLHPRYAPHFNISWRRKKGMLLKADELRVLFFGTEAEWEKLIKNMDKRYRTIKCTTGSKTQRSLF